MMKLIVNNRTDALKTDINLFFTMTNNQLVRFSLVDVLHEYLHKLHKLHGFVIALYRLYSALTVFFQVLTVVK